MATVVNPDNMEAIKLHLIKTQTPVQDPSFSFSQEAIRNMVKALEFADTTLANEIESFLVLSGETALSEVAKGLLSSNNKVRSTCAMVMIRTGVPSIQVVKNLYQTSRHPEAIGWVIEFILGELGQPLPKRQVNTQWDNSKVIALGCAV